MSDLWYTIQVSTDYPDLVNQFLIVPSTWISKSKDGKKHFTKFLETPFSEEDVDFYNTLSETRGVPPESWKNYEIIRQVGDISYSFLDASIQLGIVTGNQTIQNSDASSRVERLLDVPSLPNKSLNVVSGPGTAIGKQSSDKKGPGTNEGGPGHVMIKESDLANLFKEMAALKVLFTNEMEKLRQSTATFTETTKIEIQNLKMFLIAKKSEADRAKIMDWETLIKKHDLEKDFLHSEGEKTTAFFPTYDKFEFFEKNYMANPNFVEDLKKFFYTTINPTDYYFKEILRILKIFFHGKWLHEKFVGSKDTLKDKKAFKDTKFAIALTSSLLTEFKGVKWSGNYNKNKLENTEISEEGIYRAYGHACTRCTDWGQGRSERGTKRRSNDIAEHEI